MKRKKRGGLALLLECEIEAPQLNASKLTIKTYGVCECRQIALTESTKIGPLSFKIIHLHFTQDLLKAHTLPLLNSPSVA